MNNNKRWNKNSRITKNHPFDVFLYKIIRYITPTFKKLNFTL